MYDKKIAYVHYVKNKELMGSAGHVKVMYRGNSISLEVYVRDMQMLSNGYYFVKGLGENSFEDKIHIERGQAVYKKRLNVDKSNENQVPYGIKIEIAENEYLEAVWQTGRQQEKEIKAAESGQSTEEWKKRITKNAQSTEEWKKRITKNAQSTGERVQRITENIKSIDKLEEKGNDSVKEKIQNTETKTWNQLTFSVPVEMYEDKWKELCKKYDVVYPFGNGEAYISISPKDFIIFPEKYQNLVNNSFLLHGYYNYQHIILGKKEEGSKNVYYLGVPGVYYEREKMVAIMFGFEGFECGDKRAYNGGFGYYMRRVEL